MDAIKISLHDGDPATGQPPMTIVAFTKEYAAAKGLNNRLIAKMARTEPVAPGWHHELTIATPTITFGAFEEIPPLGPNETMQWWTPPPYPEQLTFQLYVGDAGSVLATLSNHIGDVCQMQLGHGRRLWIVAQSEPMHDSAKRWIEEHVAGLSTGPNVVHPFTLRKDGDRTPVLLDLAVTWRRNR
jgi:hypothetical protein